MSSNHIRLREQNAAIERLTHWFQRLQLELAMGRTERRHLDPLVELLELYVERTGGNLYTQVWRRQIAEIKREVARRGFRVVR